jgi:hypothetical protein
LSNPINEGGPRFFQTVFLTEADLFIARMNVSDREKLFRKIYQAERVRDPALFKKLSNEIWELRFRMGNLRLRVLAFWDKRQPTKTLVVATHAFVKKTDRVPEKEIDKAVRIRRFYFEHTHNN